MDELYALAPAFAGCVIGHVGLISKGWKDATAGYFTGPLSFINRKSYIVNISEPWTAIVQPSPVKWPGMKLKNIIPKSHPSSAHRLLAHRSALRAWLFGQWRRHRCRLIRQFGKGKLVRLPDGHHEFIGGTDDDCRDALLWASLFAHEIVFKAPRSRERERVGGDPVRVVGVKPPTVGRVTPRAPQASGFRSHNPVPA